jgi:hypothetical protein
MPGELKPLSSGLVAQNGRLAGKNIFIHAHRFLLVSFVFLNMKPLVVVHFYLPGVPLSILLILSQSNDFTKYRKNY